MASLTDLLATMNSPGQPVAGSESPSLLDLGSAFFRSRLEGGSVSGVLDKQRTQRLAEQSLARQEQRQGLSDALSVANYQIELAKAEATKGNAEAKAVFDAWQALTKDLAPEDAATVWAEADALPDDVSAGNAMSVFSGIIRNKGLAGKGKDGTAGMQDYKFAVEQGYRGTFMDFLKEKGRAGATTVNVGPTGIDYGNPPKDMAWARNADGTVMLVDGPDGTKRPRAVPIAGGPMEAEIAAGKDKTAANEESKRATADIVTEDIGRAIGIIENATIPASGVVGYLTAGVPGTSAFNATKLIEGVKANVSFDKLQAMRAASPTGAALGPVSDFENRLLQATLGNLETAQDKEQLLYNLNRVKEIYSRIIDKGIKPGDPIAQGASGGWSAKRVD